MTRPYYLEWENAPPWAGWLGWNDDGVYEFTLFDPRPWHALKWQHVEKRPKHKKLL
ncbi:hypothetical protein Xoosp13_99 [Xanthomonas phage Xoo-sp13]|nr:hypothetical protein Xoosp13_99 [Xanthomonas phage Xoo-sp13]